jgi:hypothetical protein
MNRVVARELAWRVVPGVMADRAIRWNVASDRLRGGWTQIREVEHGPFSGMVYPEETAQWVIAPALKESGEYEAALLPALSAELRRSPACFVDIGAADGYYAVGAARMGVHTIAYESSPIQRRAIRSLAAANGVHVDVRRHCRHVPRLPDNSVILMDAEGAEKRLLTRTTARRLAASTVFVELHEQFARGVTEVLLTRFAGTHQAEIIRGVQEPGRAEPPVWAVFRPARHRANACDAGKGYGPGVTTGGALGGQRPGNPL